LKHGWLSIMEDYDRFFVFLKIFTLGEEEFKVKTMRLDQTAETVAQRITCNKPAIEEKEDDDFDAKHIF